VFCSTATLGFAAFAIACREEFSVGLGHFSLSAVVRFSALNMEDREKIIERASTPTRPGGFA
jgi:hypothetical protein